MHERLHAEPMALTCYHLMLSPRTLTRQIASAASHPPALLVIFLSFYTTIPVYCDHKPLFTVMGHI